MFASTDDESDPDVLLLRSLVPAKYFQTRYQNGLPRIVEAAKHVAFEKDRRPQPEVASLAERSLRVFVQDVHITHFEILVVEQCPKSLYPRILAAALLTPRPRLFLIRILLRHWPIKTLNVDDLRACYAPFAKLLAEVEKVKDAQPGLIHAMDTAALENELKVDRILVVILESFAASIGYAHHRMRLKCLDLRHLPWKLSRHELLYDFLVKFEPLLSDWASMDQASNIRIPVLMTNDEDEAVQPFWTQFLKRNPTFVKAHSVVLQSPLLTGDTAAIRTVMKYTDTKALQSLHVIGELMFNDGGGYETDVDHLRDTFNGLYRQEMPFWMSKLKNFTNLVQLDLANPTPIPLTEASGGGIKLQAKELKRLSPCALKNWISILPHVSPSLRSINFKGQMIQGHLEKLLGKVQFTLKELDIENCGLISSDFAFLGRSRHRSSLQVLRIGDINLGKKFGGILQMLKGLSNLETLDMCLPGYDRYTNNTTFDDSQAMELIFTIKTQYVKTMRHLNLGGGHQWTKLVLFKALKHLVPMPHLQLLVLPVDGLGQESIEVYHQFKDDDLRFKYKLDKCGEEFKELHKATIHYLREDVYAADSLCRQGYMLEVQHPSPHRSELLWKQRVEMKKLEQNITDEVIKREKEEALMEVKMKEKRMRDLNRRKDDFRSREKRKRSKSNERGLLDLDDMYIPSRADLTLPIKPVDLFDGFALDPLPLDFDFLESSSLYSLSEVTSYPDHHRSSRMQKPSVQRQQHYQSVQTHASLPQQQHKHQPQTQLRSRQQQQAQQQSQGGNVRRRVQEINRNQGLGLY